MYLLGADIGTTSIKAAVFDENKKIISSSLVDYTLITEGDRVEFDAEEYFRLFLKAINECAGDKKIEAMSIDTQCETLILTDDAGIPLTNAIVWLDNRATKEAEDIEAHFGQKRVYEVTGQAEITATWPACKLLWVKRNMPDIFAKTKKIFLLEDWILFKLTGKFVTEKTLQSSTIYFDITKGCWWKEMLDFIGVSEAQLPQLNDSAVKIGEYNGTAVVTGAMDQIAGAIGAGVIREGMISEMTGTAMVLFVPCGKIPEYRPESKIPCHYNFNNSYALVLWTPAAGMALKWFKNNFAEDFTFAQLDEIAAKVPYGCEGLVMLPHLCGSTTPKYNPDARGCFNGFTLAHTRAHATRAILEGVACMLKDNLDYINLDIDEIRAMGGGAGSPLWCGIKADITQKKLVTLKNKETACLGSAILAGVGVGIFDSVEKACEDICTDRIYSPSGEDVSFVYENYKKLDSKLN